MYDDEAEMVELTSTDCEDTPESFSDLITKHEMPSQMNHTSIKRFLLMLSFQF